jgi:retron-type reverse transcriptase
VTSFSFIARATGNGRIVLDKAKTWSIPKRWVWDAYKRVKANRGAAGVDDQSIDNLYKLWNRMSSGSYFPPPVKRVQIAKRGGVGTRPLGIPTHRA